MSKKESEITLKDIHDDLTKLIKLVKLGSFNQVKDALNSILDNDTKKLIYQFSDGTKSTEVVKKAKSSAQTVSDCWKLWLKLGIGETIEVTGGKRFKRSFDLEDFGLLSK